MQVFERYLIRWRTAGLLDEAAEAAIRAYESADTKPSGRRWQVILSLIMGGILLGAGILLFVAAHWDDVSPGWRLTLVLAMLSLFHLAGVAAKNRFEGFATAMYALGTVAAGAANRPGGKPGFSICRSIGRRLCCYKRSVRSQDGGFFKISLQQTLALLLVPAWLVSEWSFRADVYNGSGVYIARMIAVLACVDLTALPSFSPSHRL